MLLRNSDVKESFGKCTLEGCKTGGIAHRRGNCADALIFFSRTQEAISHLCGKVTHGGCARRGNAVVRTRILLCGCIALALDGLEMQDNALPLFLSGKEKTLHGKIIVAENLDNAVELANLLAPEHLELCIDNPFDYEGGN